MAKLIVEVLTRSGAHVAYHKVETLPVTIGRALDNDIILPDPCVSSKHLTIEEGSENWIVIDHGTANGTLLSKGGTIEGPTEITSGTQLLAGKTVLRVLSPSHAVPEAQPAPPPQGPREGPFIPVLSVVSIIATGAVVAFTQFLDVAKEIKPITLLANSLPLLFFPFLWAGIWASTGFIVRRRALFGRQLLIANCAFILILLVTMAYEYLDYFTGSATAADIFQYACMAVLSSLVLFLNLKTAAGNVGFKRILLSFVIGTGVVAAIALTGKAESFEKNLTPEYSQTLKPPYAKHQKSMSLEEFVRESGKLFENKDKAEEK